MPKEERRRRFNAVYPYWDNFTKEKRIFSILHTAGASRKCSEIRTYKLKEKVLKRDGYSCYICDSEYNLELHHILPRRLFPEFRNVSHNCVALCFNCHAKTESYGNKAATHTREEYINMYPHIYYIKDA